MHLCTDTLCHLSRDKGKGVFGVNVNCKGQDQSAGIFSLIRNFSVPRYVLQYANDYQRTVKAQISLRIRTG